VTVISMSAGAPPPPPVLGQIPDWTVSGVLPPYLGEPTLAINMAPYPTTVSKIIDRFAFSRKRIEILQGFLAYRQLLSNVGIIDGFQWLCGSIFENIEILESRDPNDIDIITFFRRPVGARDPITWGHFFAANRNMFSAQFNKFTFKCDTQFIDLDASSEDVANLTRFWFGLFSHRRNDLWKGMLTIPLATSPDDLTAQQALIAMVPPAPSSTGGPTV
jgi:hypothetical protein